MNIKYKISRLRLLLSDVKPLLLSHHPPCEKFDEHVYHIGNKKLCIGCFTYYPTVLITFVLTLLFVELTFYNLAFLGFIAFLFFTPITLNILGLTKFKILKILSKVSIGIGTGFYLVSVIFLPFFLPIHLIFQILVMIVLILMVNWFTGVIAYIRAIHIQKDCAECEYKGDWNSCPTMKPIIDKLNEHNFKTKKQKS